MTVVLLADENQIPNPDAQNVFTLAVDFGQSKLEIFDRHAGLGNHGDLNNDNVVDNLDVDLEAMGINAARNARTGGNSQFDLDGNGLVNEGDYDFLLEAILGSSRPDGNLDGVINFEDFASLANNYNMSETGFATGNYAPFLASSINRTDFADFVVLSNKFGPTTLSQRSVPEPGALVLMLSAGLGSVATRRRLTIR